MECEAGPAANNPGPRAVLRRHAPSATRQRTLASNGIDRGAGPVLDRIVGRVRTRKRGEVRLADKKAAKRRRRENKEAREKAKAERTGPSPAQEAEAVRNVEAEDPREAERRTGLDGSLGGDTASNIRPSQ